MSAELACTYAALILNDDGVDITADKITSILKVVFTNFFTGWVKGSQVTKNLGLIVRLSKDIQNLFLHVIEQDT